MQLRYNKWQKRLIYGVIATGLTWFFISGLMATYVFLIWTIAVLAWAGTVED